MSDKKTNAAEIERALRLILTPGQVTELRALDAASSPSAWAKTISGYYNDLARLAADAASISHAKGIYFVPNPIKPALLARSVNKARPIAKEPTTSDADIERRNWLLIDCDAVRPSGIAASDEEHAAALERATAIDAWLAEQGWPAPIVADSGNGGHLLYRIDLPADDGGLVQRCLAALAKQFDDAAVTVDTGVFNPARIWKLYGTLAGKGDVEASAIGRPHRMSRILHAPEAIAVVSREQLEGLAGASGQPDQIANPAPKISSSSFDLDAWIREHGLDVTGPESWNGNGRRWVFKRCPWNPDHTNGSAFIAQFANGAITGGCHHNGCQGKGWRELRTIFDREYAERQSAFAVPSEPRKSSERDASARPVLVNLADVQAKPIEWLWPGRIARGALTLIAGEPGQGKSTMLADLSARVTKGSPWPDQCENKPGTVVLATPGSVVLLSAEDDIAHTIRPRLDAAGADVAKVTALQGVEFGNDSHERCFNLESDLPALEAAIKASPDCRLIVVDPVSSYMGKVDSHKNAETRGLLAPLTKLASDYGVAVVMVTHFSKGQNRTAMHAPQGSIGFIGAARAAWAVVADKDDSERRLFLPIKNNLAKNPGGLAFRIVDRVVSGQSVGVVEWESGTVNTTADEALNDDPDRGPSQAQQAADWLMRFLADGPKPKADIDDAAEAEMISPKTLRNGKKLAGVQSHKDGFQGEWVWFIPGQGLWGKDAPEHALGH